MGLVPSSPSRSLAGRCRRGDLACQPRQAGLALALMLLDILLFLLECLMPGRGDALRPLGGAAAALRLL
jgi:hypothetical protein